MNCDVCKQNQATVFLTQIVEGKMQKVNLCENCSKEKGVTDPTGFALADLLLGLGAAQEIERGGPVQNVRFADSARPISKRPAGSDAAIATKHSAKVFSRSSRGCTKAPFISARNRPASPAHWNERRTSNNCSTISAKRSRTKTMNRPRNCVIRFDILKSSRELCPARFSPRLLTWPFTIF